jgi:hypothetical protein
MGHLSIKRSVHSANPLGFRVGHASTIKYDRKQSTCDFAETIDFSVYITFAETIDFFCIYYLCWNHRFFLYPNNKKSDKSYKCRIFSFSILMHSNMQINYKYCVSYKCSSFFGIPISIGSPNFISPYCFTKNTQLRK